MWARGYSLINIQHEVEIASEAAVNWASYCREVCLISFIDNPEQLGGEGKTVEIDMFTQATPRKKVFAAAEDAGHVERNDGRSEARPSCSKDHARSTLRSSTKIVFPAKFHLFINIWVLDESKFGRRKFWRGHRVEGCWVFGGVERESGRVFMEVVEKRDAGTLLPLLEKWVKKGTTVVSDCWKAYTNMSGYHHLTVILL